jgi:hypothetical protein
MDRYTQQLVNELRDASRDKVPMSVELCGQSAVQCGWSGWPERLKSLKRNSQSVAEQAQASSEQRQWLSRSAQATQTNGTETVFSKNQLTKTSPELILLRH